MICEKLINQLAVKTATTQTKSTQVDLIKQAAQAGFACIAATSSRQV